MKSLLIRALVGFLFIVLIFNSRTAFAGTDFSRENFRFWETNFQSGVTKRSYNRIKIGMSFNTVNRIIGFKGTVMTRNVGGGKVFISVKWEGRNYAIITAVFRDNILTNKYEANLR